MTKARKVSPQILIFSPDPKTNAAPNTARGGHSMPAVQNQEKNDTFYFQPRDSSDFWFACVDIDGDKG